MRKIILKFLAYNSENWYFIKVLKSNCNIKIADEYTGATKAANLIAPSILLYAICFKGIIFYLIFH